jgi:glycosyltransferase involved in cell wall biosynthesis
MGKKGKKSKVDVDVNLPFISICTPTFNRRPFIPIMIKCFEHQTYPKDKIEWIIVDDGTDKIEDLVKHIPQVKYFSFKEKLTLGKKRNIANDNSTGEIIIYMDDDDYYPPERFSHAVDVLNKNPKALCAGSSAMLIYFKHINKMYQFGPYGPNHATAATFAFRRELLKQTRFNELSSVAEEKQFLKDYTIPFVQLESIKSILVFSHVHNSFDKKELLNQMPNPHVHETVLTPSDIIKQPEILNFFTVDIDILLSKYEFGNTNYKPDVVKQIAEIKKTREEMINKQMAYQNSMQLLNNPQFLQSKINDLTNTINSLKIENSELKDKVQYLDNKIKQIITDHIQKKTSVKEVEHSSSGPKVTIV